MATSSTRNQSRNQSSAATARAEKNESPQELTNDVVEYLTDYARQKPGYAALWCLGIGFVLGWKLKPW